MNFKFQNIFTENLPADVEDNNEKRQVKNACFSKVKPTKCSHPQKIHFNENLAIDLGLYPEFLSSNEFLEIVSGNKIVENSSPYSMCYGGHQFGHWAGQLGDGRAINLFEQEFENKFFTWQLKGAGKTPYSRNADGLAVLRSSIREYLCSEAMFYLNVPTTRALSLISTGDKVLRDILYNGNPEYEKGAIVCRIAPSFLRFGNFQIHAARNETEILKQLTDFTINNFYTHLGTPNKEIYLKFFNEVVEKTIKLMVEWERVGFVHGVMNTDNMSILGLTIDYGPYGWLENYDPNWTPNTTDAQYKRYRFGNQANIAFWNLLQLANALYSLVEEAKPLEDILQQMKSFYLTEHYKMMFSKLGLNNDENNISLIEKLKDLLEKSEMDYTLFFREIIYFNSFSDKFYEILKSCSYSLNIELYRKEWNQWFDEFEFIVKSQNIEEIKRTEKMKNSNPKYIFRNYMAQLAIDDANQNNFELLNELFEMLKKPYSDNQNFDKWYAKRPDWAKEKVGCSMLSCSS